MTAIVAEYRDFHKLYRLKVVVVHSIENRTPPIGAPSAAVIPTAMAAVYI